MSNSKRVTDEVTLDILLRDENGQLLGRPHVGFTLDEASRHVIGVSINLNGPRQGRPADQRPTTVSADEGEDIRQDKPAHMDFKLEPKSE